MKFLKIWLWLYAVVGSAYFAMYEAGAEIVQRYAVGPLWLMMVIAPVILAMLIFWPLLVNMLPDARMGERDVSTAKAERILQRRRDLGL